MTMRDELAHGANCVILQARFPWATLEKLRCRVNATGLLRIRREPPRILITNPDMVHLCLLAHHHLWRVLFRNFTGNSFLIDWIGMNSRWGDSGKGVNP